jgi:hypothetical protein
MSNAIKTQHNLERQRTRAPDDLLDSSVERQLTGQKSNTELVSELITNLSGLANIDFSSMTNNGNIGHLLKATNHLKIAQNEFQMAK